MKDYAPRRRRSAPGAKKQTKSERSPPPTSAAGPRPRLESRLARWTRYSPWILAALGLLAFSAIGARYYWRELRFRYIVVHHTASNYGNLEYYRRLHVEERGWSDIAYHFVINNGTDNTSMGEIQESELWRERQPNHSTRVWFVNYFAIAVVMVGDFERRPPPARQQDALVGLLARLARDHNIAPERIIGHREVQNTACPGRYLDMVDVRAQVAARLGQAPSDQ